MIFDYIEKNFDKGEPIFLGELPYKSKDALRQALKYLVDSGKLNRVRNGIYYRRYKTILGTEGKMSIGKYIEKKYLFKNNEISGYISGIGLYNKYGFTTQIPSVISLVSNLATTKQRKINIDGYNIIVYKPITKINKDNINEIEFLDLITNIDLRSELPEDELNVKLKEYIDKKKINFNIVKKLLNKCPDKTYRNSYLLGLMRELL